MEHTCQISETMDICLVISNKAFDFDYEGTKKGKSANLYIRTTSAFDDLLNRQQKQLWPLDKLNFFKSENKLKHLTKQDADGFQNIS